MGGHKGYSIVERPLGDGAMRYLARAYDPHSRRHRSQTFVVRAAAVEWAKDLHADFRRQVDRQRAASEMLETTALARDYLASLERRGLSETYRHDTAVILGQLAHACARLDHPRAGIIITQWIDGLRNLRQDEATAQRLSARSRNKYLVTVRAFCGWAVKQKMLRQDPTELIESAKEDKTLKPQFTVDELRCMVAASRDPRHLLVCLMVYAGLRSEEACHLRWEDIDLSGRQISLRLRAAGEPGSPKGRKERLVPIQEELRRILSQTPKDQRVGRVIADAPNNAHRSMQRFLARQGLPVDGRGPHSCRHSYAGLMTATGVPSISLASYMGHGSTATTAGYAAQAERYMYATKGWKRGEFRLLSRNPQ
jgi:integrase/recombinase XerD